MAAQTAVGDVVDVDAVEHLSGLDDAMRGALAQPVDGAAAGAVDAGETEDLHVRSSGTAPNASHSCSAAMRRRPRVEVASVGVASSIQAPWLSP